MKTALPIQIVVLVLLVFIESVHAVTVSIPGIDQMVIDAINPPTVTLVNAEGTTPDGKPYYHFGNLAPGETSVAKELVLNNPNRLRFDLVRRFWAKVDSGECWASGGRAILHQNGSRLLGWEKRYRRMGFKWCLLLPSPIGSLPCDEKDAHLKIDHQGGPPS